MTVDKDTLKRLVGSRWERIWTQGGRFRRYPQHPHGVYSEIMVVETVAGLFQIGVATTSLPGATEEYEIDLVSPDSIGTDTTERLFSPRRQAVSEYPPDLDLEALLGRDQIKVSVVREGKTPGDPLRPRELRDCGLLFEASGRQVLVLTDVEVPESTLLTSDMSLIGAFLGNLSVDPV